MAGDFKIEVRIEESKQETGTYYRAVVDSCSDEQFENMGQFGRSRENAIAFLLRDISDRIKKKK